MDIKKVRCKSATFLFCSARNNSPTWRRITELQNFYISVKAINHINILKYEIYTFSEIYTSNKNKKKYKQTDNFDGPKQSRVREKERERAYLKGHGKSFVASPV